jgi:hypothetical protein
MPRNEPRADEEHFGEASLDEAQAAKPPTTDEVVEPDADPLEAPVEDAEPLPGEAVGEEEAEEFEHPN